MKDFRISRLNDIYGVLLSTRQRQVLRDYFDFDLSYGEIAETMNISRQAVGQVIEAATKQLESLEQGLKLLRILEQLQELVEQTTDEATRTRLMLIAEQIRSS